MTKKKRIGEHDHVVTAWAESANGPGWANQPVWFLIRSALDGSFRVDCLQPREQSRDMHLLYKISEDTHRAMVSAVRRELAPKRRAVSE